MSPEAMFESLVVSLGTVPVGLVMSIEDLLGQAASLVMATEAIPKPLAYPVASMEVVPESTLRGPLTPRLAQ